MDCIKNQKGFSLIEIMIAITIFAVGLLAVANMQFVSAKGNTDSQFVTVATALGQGQMERLMALPYNHADLDSAAAVNPHTFVDGNYTYSWTITEGDLLTNTKTIVLDVNYNARGLAKRTRIIAAKADVI